MRGNWRSLLFVPANEHGKLARIAGRCADAIIIDLEDGVPETEKPQAREDLPDVITMLTRQAVDIIVRINGGWLDAFADLDIAVRLGVRAIMVPKVEGAARITVIGEIIRELAERRNCPVPALIALLESPAGIAEANAIAAVDGVAGLAFGTEDFALSMGVSPDPSCLHMPCQVIAWAAARHGCAAFGLPISITTIDAGDAWRSAAATARTLGMTGALCVHPGQIDAVNGTFDISDHERREASRLLAAWHDAGCPGAFKFEGRMVDRPVVLAAQRRSGVRPVV